MVAIKYYGCLLDADSWLSGQHIPIARVTYQGVLLESIGLLLGDHTATPLTTHQGVLLYDFKPPPPPATLHTGTYRSTLAGLVLSDVAVVHPTSPGYNFDMFVDIALTHAQPGRCEIRCEYAGVTVSMGFITFGTETRAFGDIDNDAGSTGAFVSSERRHVFRMVVCDERIWLYADSRLLCFGRVPAFDQDVIGPTISVTRIPENKCVAYGAQNLGDKSRDETLLATTLPTAWSSVIVPPPVLGNGVHLGKLFGPTTTSSLETAIKDLSFRIDGGNVARLRDYRVQSGVAVGDHIVVAQPHARQLVGLVPAAAVEGDVAVTAFGPWGKSSAGTLHYTAPTGYPLGAGIGAFIGDEAVTR